MKYRIGQQVRIKKEFWKTSETPKNNYFKEATNMAGKTATIKEIRTTQYFMTETECGWYENELEPINNKIEALKKKLLKEEKDGDQ